MYIGFIQEKGKNDFLKFNSVAISCARPNGSTVRDIFYHNSSYRAGLNYQYSLVKIHRNSEFFTNVSDL